MIRHEDIVKIQNEFWIAYKEYRKDHDILSYNGRIIALIAYYTRDENKSTAINAIDFCTQMQWAWGNVINEDNIGKIADHDVMDIQNGFWRLYMQLRQTKNIKPCIADANQMLMFYERGNQETYGLCSDLYIIWAQLFYKMADRAS